MDLEQLIELNKRKYSPIKKWLKSVSEVIYAMCPESNSGGLKRVGLRN